MSTPFLAATDVKFLATGLFGNGPTVVTAVPMIRKQGNGNFTGFVRTTYSDGSVINADFIMNAKTREAVAAAYANAGF